MHTSASLDCPYSVTTCQLEAYGTSRWAGLEVQGAFDWLKDSRLVTTIGTDARARSVASKSSVRDFDTGVPLASSAGVVEANDRILGTYVQQTYKPSDLLGLNGGVRFDAEKHTGLVASPRIAASTAPWRGGTLKAIYSQAFRAASWHELSYEMPNKQMRAEDLQPEHVQSGEVSLEQKLGMQRIIYGVFVSEWTNLIELHELSPAEVADAQAQGKLGNHAVNVSQFRNVSSIDSLGLNFGLDGTIGGQLHYGFNLTAAHSDRDLPDGTEQPLVVAPKLFGNARAAYALPAPWPTLAIAGRYQGRRLIEDAYEPRFTTPPTAPPLLELRATVSGPFPGLTGLSYRASADYAFVSGGPYAIGPLNGFNRYSVSRPTTAELIPIDRFRTTLGLQYDFN
jgi:outer membrane receptor for ferrienterochelin and colicin